MSQVSIRPFDLITNAQNGGAGATVNLAVLATTANVAVSPAGIGNRTVRLFNSGTNVVFVNFGPSTVTATLTNSFPMLPNSVETFYFHNDWTHVAAIAGGTGNTLYATMGESS
jgi:hypothetical protein